MAKNCKDDIFYTASILEYLARKTQNRIADIAKKVGLEGIRACYQFADVNHCLSFDQVSGEIAKDYGVLPGSFERSEPDGRIPSYTAIGKNYAAIVTRVQTNADMYPEELYRVLTSRISEWMEDYRSAFYYSTWDAQAGEYKELLQEHCNA